MYCQPSPRKSISSAACACAALIALTGIAAQVPASAQQPAAARHKAALAAKAKASGLTPLPSTGAGSSTVPSNAAAPGGPAQNAVILYSGQPLASSQVQAASWGGGTAVDHNGDAYTAAGHTIEIDTAGLYQGGQIAFASPVQLGDLKSQPNRYLQIIFSAAPSQSYPGYGGASSASLPLFAPLDAHSQTPPGSYQIAQYPGAGAQNPNAGRNPYGGGYPGAPNPYGGRGPYGGAPNPYGGGAARTPGQDEVDELPTLAISYLHVIYEYADGSRSETLRPISVTLGDDINWLRASIPLSAIPAAPSGSVQLAKLYLGTDVPATLNVGEIRLITDTTALTADAGSNKTVPVNTPVILVGTGEGGASTLKYEWNFDSPNAATFVPEEEGVKANYTFTTPGDHIVTLRVSDMDGIKSPATAVVTIHVEDIDAAPGAGAPNPYGGAPGAPRAPSYPGYPRRGRRNF